MKLESVVDMASLLYKWYDQDISVFVADTEKVVLAQNHPKLNLGIKEGIPLQKLKNTVVFKALKQQQWLMEKVEVDQSLFSMPYVLIAGPIQDGDKTVGVMEIILSAKKNDTLIKAGEKIYSTIEQISASAQNMLSTSEEFASTTQTMVSEMDSVKQDIEAVALEVRKLADYSQSAAANIKNDIKHMHRSASHLIGLCSQIAAACEKQTTGVYEPTNCNRFHTITGLYNNTQKLVYSLDMSNIAEDICRTCVETLGLSLAWLGKAEEDGSVRVIGVYPNKEYPYKIAVRWDDCPAGWGPAGEAIRNGVPIFINNIREDSCFELWREMALKYGIESSAAFPLISKGKSFGAINVYAQDKDFFNLEKAYYIQTYVNQAAAALQNAKLYDKSERHAACLQSLHQIDNSIINNLDLEVTLSIILDQVISRLYVDAADVFVMDEEKGALKFTAGMGLKNCVHGEFSLCLESRDYLKLLELYKGFCENNCTNTNFPLLDERRKRLSVNEGLTHYCCVPLFCKGKFQGIMEFFRREPFSQDEDLQTFRNMLANQTAIAIDASRLFSELKRSNRELTDAYDETIAGWSKALDLRDKETEGHSQRVTEMTLHLAMALGIDESRLIHVRRGALLHDIGKMGIPDSILLKPGPLNQEEWQIMKKHPDYAYEMLSPIEYIRPALDIPYAHHEKWDGTGYPRGLKGKQIPLAARIFAIVDVWDALGSDRPYRKAWEKKKILEHIRFLSGSHFDPDIVDLFFKMIAD